MKQAKKHTIIIVTLAILILVILFFLRENNKKDIIKYEFKELIPDTSHQLKVEFDSIIMNNSNTIEN